MGGGAAVVVDSHPGPVSRVLSSADGYYLSGVGEVAGAVNGVGGPVPGQLGVG